jgi:hypothetical protein
MDVEVEVMVETLHTADSLWFCVVQEANGISFLVTKAIND